MATYDIDKITLPNGDVCNLVGGGGGITVDDICTIGVYAVKGDYDSGDALDEADAIIVNNIIYDNYGIAFITTTNNGVFIGSATTGFTNFAGDTLTIAPTTYEITITPHNS